MFSNLMMSFSNGDYINVVRQLIAAIAIWPLVKWFWRDEIRSIKNFIATKLNTKKEAA